MMDVLGVSGFYHDSAAALVRNGAVVAAAQEQFSRLEHDPSLPPRAIERDLLRDDQPMWTGEVAPIELD